MTDQKAITPYSKLKTMLGTDDVRERFQQILGQKAPGFMASVLNTVYLNDNLRECEPNSILTSALTAAVLDLPIDPNLGFSYIIPYKDHGTPKARFQVGYKGFIQLALRTGQYQAINVTEIYEGENVRQDRLTGKIILNGHRNGSGVVGYCAYFKLNTGFEKFLYMTTEEIRAHAEKFSQSYKYDSSVWAKNFDAMAKKTVLKALISRYGIMSIQMQNVERQDEPAQEDEPSTVIDARAEEVTEPPASTDAIDFDPVAVLVDEHISENRFAATGLLKSHVPAEIKTNRDALIKWGKLYRGWRDLNATPEQAAEKATAGEVPQS